MADELLFDFVACIADGIRHEKNYRDVAAEAFRLMLEVNRVVYGRVPEALETAALPVADPRLAALLAEPRETARKRARVSSDSSVSSGSDSESSGEGSD